MKRKTIRDLDRLMGPKRVKRAKAAALRKMETMLIGEVRKQLGFTQAALAKTMGVSQSALSQLEAQDDMQMSTLRRLVQALGGELALVARFGNRSIVLTDAATRN